MPKFAANLTMLFNEVPFLDRFERAAKAGFTAVEFLFPYAYPAQELKARLQANGLQLVLHNLPPGNWDGGERGIACLPGRDDEFKRGIEQALHYAAALHCPRIHVMAGLAPEGSDRTTLRATYLANLAWAAAQAAPQGIDVLIEPINFYDIPGFYLNTTAQALSILDEVGDDNAYVQYDIYHAQRMEGELAATMAKNLSRIAHMQLADNPGRNEPGTGEINYTFLFAHLDRIGYSGWIGCEYKPAGLTEAGLGWRQRLAQ